ncbi:unnamed protein product [Euphydryas editha]|uniref:Uncharacterized protein n=1 Tax=Euphydryas editha TaxID=104508 RepID=A0AAU9TCQ7_EUPED|nr:unnamed protein product [Euphydryas editha]
MTLENIHDIIESTKITSYKPLKKYIGGVSKPATFSATIDTFQAIEDNKWIFILKKSTPYVIECADKILNKEISDAGIISLSPGCKFYTAFVTINAEKDTESNIITVIYPITIVNLEDNCISDSFKTTPRELLAITIRNIPLDALNFLLTL